MPVKLFHGTKIGQFTPLEQVQVVDTVQKQTQNATPFPSDIDLSASSLSAFQKEELLALLHRFSHVFVQEGEPRGRRTVVKHHIKQFDLQVNTDHADCQHPSRGR